MGSVVHQLNTGITAISSAVTATGQWVHVSAPMLLRAFLSAAGGTATLSFYGRISPNGPRRLLCTFGLSGANDAPTPYLLNEPWKEIQAEISAIAGGAVASGEIGY